MATPVQMPALSPTMKEGKISKWLKKEGEKVASGQPIAEIETDKANLEFEATDDGVLLKLLLKEGESAPVGAPIAVIGAPGEKVDLSAIQAAPAPAPAEAAPPPAPSPVLAPPAPAARVERAPAPPLAPAPPPPTALPTRRAEPSNGRLRASPLARRMARDQGLDLAMLRGTGPAGRIVKRDVEQAIAAGLQAKAPLVPMLRPFERRAPVATPLTTMRKVIAQRMTEVKPGVPHFYLTVEVEMDAALKIREEAKALDTKISVNDIVVKAAAVALRRFPKLNVQYAGDQVLQLQNIDVGIAVAIEDGLITPVLRDADMKGLQQIAAESRELAERARKRKLRPEEYTGGSISVSNLGMFGIDSFVAVINPPQASILAVGMVSPKAVVRDGQIVARQMMSLTLSGDHRVVDGAIGAQYLQELKSLLEHPIRLLF